AAVPVRRDDIFLNVLPYFHIYALNLLMSGAISLGATQVIMPRFDMVEYCTLVERQRATVCFIVPPIVLGLAMSPEVEKHDFSSVRFFFSGWAPRRQGLRVHRRSQEGVHQVQGIRCRTRGGRGGPVRASRGRRRRCHRKAERRGR